MNTKEVKLFVQEKYATIASQNQKQYQSSCCGGTDCCNDMDYSIFSDDYTTLEGYNADADLRLGCGLPTHHAGITKGDHVLDLGSGAGNDCFVARSLVGDEGKVTGIDFTDAMLEKARENLEKTGFKNIEFIKGDIEEIPLPDSAFDIVISNCVLNLVPDKTKAFTEIYRVLKPGGHFCISDVVISGNLPKKIQEAAEMYAGCVSGAIQKNKYIDIIKQQGFTNITIHQEKEINVPDEMLLQYLTNEELADFKKQNSGIFSITLNANK